MPYYNFAGVCLELVSDYDSEFSRMKSFLSKCEKESYVKVSLNGSSLIERPTGKQLLNEFIKTDIRMVLVDMDDAGISFYMERESSGVVLSRLDTDRSWNHVVITYLKEEDLFEHYSLGILGSLVIRNKITMFGGLAMHASAVMHNNQGIIFSAPSGTGKSTHARLWEDFLGARILNEDCPVLRIINGKPFVFGTPWSGSSDKFDNSSAPLTAIIVLKQAKENRIVRLDSINAVQKLMPRCYLPYYDRSMMNMAIDTFEKIVKLTPVYLLECTPEKEAMELVYQCMK